MAFPYEHTPKVMACRAREPALSGRLLGAAKIVLEGKFVNRYAKAYNNKRNKSEQVNLIWAASTRFMTR